MKKFVFILCIMLVFLVFFNTCKRQTFVAPDGAVLVLTAERLKIGFNESVKIYITGYGADGTMLWSGTQVDFTVDNGTLNKYSLELEDGFGEVVATGNMERGIMKIWARSGNISATSNNSATGGEESTSDGSALEIQVGRTMDVARINLEINPQILPITGGTVTLIATVLDKNNSPIPDVGVIFQVNHGQLYSNGKTIYSNANGQATDKLETYEETEIKVFAGEDVEISRTIKPGGDNEAPEANFTFSPADPVAGTKVHFNASESTGVISKWEWDFGDGWTGAGQRTHHVFDFSADDYEDSKKFKVTLTVYDNLGKYNSTSSDISISKEPLLLTVNPSPATADKTGDTEFTLYVYKVGDIEPNESITYYRSSSVDWLAIVGTTVGVINSNNGDSFNVNPAENDSGAARDGYIYVKYYRGSQEKVVTVTVTQQINVGP